MIATGVGLLALFALFAALMYARVLPALLAVPLMALALAAVAGAGLPGLGAVIVEGSVRLAPVFVTVIFGALLSRVTLSTGIAETIVDYAAEFGGDRPAVLALALTGAVALLFTSLTGLGAIIMVGSIVLPIMLTIGVPRRTAATLFLLGFALGFIFNPTQWAFYTTTFRIKPEQLHTYAYALAAIDLAVLLAFALVRFRRERGYATWAVTLEDEAPAKRRAPLWALITPLIPLALYFFFKVNPIVAFGLAALYGVLTTRPRAAIETLVASAIRGVEDVAPAVLLFMGIGMLLVATDLPSVKTALAPLVTAVAPRSAPAYVILFGLLSPLALYRGPLNPFGVGIAVYTVLAGLGIMPPLVLVAAIMAVVQVQNVCDPTNTQNVWVANFTGVRVDEISKLTLPFQVAVATLGTLAVALFGGPLLGVTLNATTPAAAAPSTELPGLFAPVSAADTIAVVAGEGRPALTSAAADEIAKSIVRSWGGFETVSWTVPQDDVPSSMQTDCAGTTYAAMLEVDVESTSGSNAPSSSGASNTLDVGLALADCSGWPVDQWHVQRDDAGAAHASAAVREAALAALFRVRLWMLDHPRLAQSLFERGLAYDPATGPTYFYTLFKTNDGQMRAFVRPGGPAYVAGLRTNDVVDKLDGKFWWEYGTFQTQARAYDGKPHVFEVTRNGRTLTVSLGSPYTGQ